MPWTASVPTPVQVLQYPQRAVPTASNVSAARTKPGSTDRVATESVYNGSPQQPLNTRINGIYTCTYSGCTLRFDIQKQLQEHKKNNHWRAHSLNNTTSVASTLLNTQDGPHRCDRINPSTNKPYNTVFSRPYDLTRHKDTIHNAGKQKIRCDLYTDEKSYSRADALSRHYRMSHPEDFLRKQHRGRGFE
ncbi:hypothetical protein C8A01DRAFT_21251 [Parachaetomium inaequale]|uniref:C2H2-type domain-containing protein n=1 Tax=Parachaetomium inaequale TaxID=2588326 RepID=A0AAN6P8R4_9PEZI|nr:hypothetical protein C8A01DRAFT_21251 [Parachaetomium inaequale]